MNGNTFHLTGLIKGVKSNTFKITKNMEIKLGAFLPTGSKMGIEEFVSTTCCKILRASSGLKWWNAPHFVLNLPFKYYAKAKA